MTELTEKKCEPCEGGVPPLSAEKIAEMLKDIPGWEVSSDNKKIHRKFNFKNFYKTMAFVNAVAFIANNEIHHPDMQIGYNYCHIDFSTHAIDGLSINDFICAAKINALEKI